MTNQLRRVTRALLSVSDKTGLIEFARALAAHWRRARLHRGHRQGDCRDRVESIRCFRPDRLSRNDGWPGQDAASESTRRIARDPEQHEHERAMKAHGIAPIDLLVVNLYPFEATVEKGADFSECTENIDIGGPAMIRAAAKNHDDVAVVVEPQDYAGRARRTCRQRRGDDFSIFAAASPPRLMPAPPLMMRRSRTGLPTNSRPRRRTIARLAGGSSRRCVTARTRIRTPLSIARPANALALRPHASVARQGAVLQQHQRHRRRL